MNQDPRKASARPPLPKTQQRPPGTEAATNPRPDHGEAYVLLASHEASCISGAPLPVTARRPML
jgi:hypothetical protein